MPVIYIDVLLALNLWIDFILLLATARILRLPRRRWRMVLGALLGAATSCLIFLPDLPTAAATAVKLAAACVILLVAFPWRGRLPYIKAVVVFFVISTLFAGMAGALYFFAAPQGFYVVGGVVYYDVSPLTLVLLTVVSYGALCLYDRFTRKKASLGRDYRLLVTCGGRTAAVRALYDSGNSLTELFSGSPVAVVRRAALESVLPAEVREALRDPAAFVSGEAGAGNGGAAAAVRSRLRLVPFRSVGGDGLLPAFRPEHLTVVAENGANRDATGAYVAVCEELGRGDYDALVGTDIAGLFDAPPAKSASFPPIAGRSSRAIGGWNGIKGGEEK